MRALFQFCTAKYNNGSTILHKANAVLAVKKSEVMEKEILFHCTFDVEDLSAGHTARVTFNFLR